MQKQNMNMEFKAQQIASLIQGTIEGNASTSVSGFAKIEEAKAGDLAFLANPKYEDYLYTTGASITIISSQLVLKQPIEATLIRVDDAYSAFAKLMQIYQQMQSTQLVGIQEPAFIHPTAKIGKDVFIGAFSYIGEHAIVGDQAKIHPQAYLGNNASLGNRSVLHPGVKVYHDCIIGQDVTIHAGSVLGSDGFGFAPQADGTYHKVPQLGNVVVEDQVEIGANTCIDRATMGSTIIRKGTKLDNLLQVAHNVEIGENSVIAAQTGISGSTKIGKGVMIGGQTGIAGHIKVADGTRAAGQSGITKSVNQPNTVLNGTPAFDAKSYLKSQAVYKRLPELEKKIQELQAALNKLAAEKAPLSS
jgi:UDP-3-O-[3-hydroxymyristoyl] glucosamine N-acyltransferase